jgi:hypothetical protein
MLVNGLILYFEAVGTQLDCLLCAVIFGIKGRTISMHAALEELTGKRWACWLCGLLNWVQQNHCADQRAGVAMPLPSYIRAFIGLIALTLILFGIGYYATLISIKMVFLLLFFVWLAVPQHG